MSNLSLRLSAAPVSVVNSMDAAAVWTLALRCANAVDMTADEARNMNRLAERTVKAIKSNNPAARLWLGQMRAFYRRCVQNPRTR